MTPRDGLVTGVFEKDWNGTLLYSFKIEDDNTFYRLGQTKPTFKVGDSVCFEDHNTNATITDVSAESGSPKDATSAGTATKSEVGVRMQYQAARADATTLVVAALHTDHLPHASNVAKGKRLDLLLGYIKQVTEQLLEEEDK